MGDLNKDEPMLEAVKIPMSMVNCCFNDVDMPAGTSLPGENFLAWPCFVYTACDKLFGDI